MNEASFDRVIRELQRANRALLATNRQLMAQVVKMNERMMQVEGRLPLPAAAQTRDSSEPEQPRQTPDKMRPKMRVVGSF